MTTAYTRDRGYSRARRMGRDEEEARQEIRELCEDPECDFGDLIAAAINAASPEQQQEVTQALREMGEDRRGPRSWAKDRAEIRRLGRDMASRDRRLGRDLGVESLTSSESPRIEQFHNRETGREEEAADRRRRMGADMAFDRSPRGSFARMYPGAAKIERL